MRKVNSMLVAGAVALSFVGMGTASAMAGKPDSVGKAKVEHSQKASKASNDHKGGKADNDDLEDRIGDRVLDAAERALIGDYFEESKNHTGAKPLPPGIAKNLKRGKPLPPGIAKTRGEFPQDLRSKLRTRDGVEPRIVGTDVILEDLATGILIDIIRDVVR